MVFALCFVLFMVGLYGVLSKKNIVKIVMGLVIMECAINLFLILLGYKRGGVAPILENRTNPADFLARSVDPLPQALVLASIIIGLGILILVVGICIRLYEKYGTFDITEIRRLKG
jgi:multicomponent Na+:H+ antiporter subunit C